ncbi:DUF333 domain-containing protein (plasmid) [Pantoea vagans]|nr:DUF333 domain-containing protein [Pantoea vagans]
MMLVNRLNGISLMLVVLSLTACTHHAEDSQRLAMRNPASVWCLQRGGQELNEKSSSGAVTYCLLPSGEKIEQWALYHRDHPQ